MHTTKKLTMIAIILIWTSIITTSSAADVNTIPGDILIGAATAAYQVEGAWDEDGKGESIWDRLLHTHPEYFDNSTGDVAADSYHKYMDDIQALKDIGAQFYRFSLSWARIMPDGDITSLNQKGIDHYNELINELLANDIIPLVTLYHWDLPQALQDLGGWANPILVDYFEDYARVVFTEFGDRVKWWITFNEPHSFAYGYSTTTFAPSLGFSYFGVAEYLVGHTVLKAHARAYHLYDEEFREEQQGKITITLDSVYFYPNSDSEEDIMAADHAMQDWIGWFAHPIYSEEGDYPAIMKEFIGNQSKAEGRYRSRLPEFDDYWINYIKGTHDFFSLNHYSSYITSYDNITGSYGISADPSWPSSEAVTEYYVPDGFRKLINWVSTQYNYPDIFITESGWADKGGLNDTMRIQYFYGYISAMLKAIYLDNCTIIGYTAWSLIDTIEWTSGHSVRYGLYDVDYDDPERPRTAKASAETFAEITRTRQIPEEYFNDII